MATWTNISDTFLEPGKPVRSVDGLALRDNPIAITEGAAGAPRIVNAAVTNGTLGAEKFQTGTAERDWVLARCAAASVGSVGTYALLKAEGISSLAPGDTAAGSALDYASAAGTTEVSPTSPPGTWRAMGFTEGSAEPVTNRTTVFLRIS